MESCRDCLNLDDRRNIDKIALCEAHYGPSATCQEFKPKSNLTKTQSCENFCVNCASFETIQGIPLCAKNHQPGVACGSFRAKKTLKLLFES